MSGTVDELKNALREALDRNGCLPSIRAKLRADIYKALGDAEVAPAKPALSNENLIINELIREYLIFNGYRETLSVFLPETGQPEVRPFERSFLSQHLNLQDGANTKQLPLMYGLVATAQGIGARLQQQQQQQASGQVEKQP